MVRADGIRAGRRRDGRGGRAERTAECPRGMREDHEYATGCVERDADELPGAAPLLAPVPPVPVAAPPEPMEPPEPVAPVPPIPFPDCPPLPLPPEPVTPPRPLVPPEAPD